MNISLVFLGHAGAGPVYSFEMAKALAVSKQCRLQVIVSKDLPNYHAWVEQFNHCNVDFHAIDTYRRNKASVLLNYFNYVRKEKLVKLILDFNADILYLPFGLMWARYVFWRVHKKVLIISTKHDAIFHDSWSNLSLPEIGSYLLNYGASKYVNGYVILNKKDKKLVEDKTHKPVCVIPHASFKYYFDKQTREYGELQHRIGFIGRIEPYKGLDILIEAFEKSKTNGLQLLIAGSGSIEKYLLSRIGGNSKIELINRYIKDEEIQPLLEKCDFVVLPYKRASQSGVIPLCFACGKTVIATDVGALSEQVPEGTGVITEPNAIKISEQIDLLYSEPRLIMQYGTAAKIYAEKELTWGHSAELLLGFAKTMIK